MISGCEVFISASMAYRVKMLMRGSLLFGAVGHRGDFGVIQQKTLYFFGGQGGGHGVLGQHLADLGLGGLLQGGQTAVLGVDLLRVDDDLGSASAMARAASITRARLSASSR